MNAKIPPLFKRDASSSSAATTKPSATAQKPAADAGKNATGPASSAPALMTGEGVMQRLRYFENLAVQHEAYIKTLRAAITRQGGAVPVAYFAPLKGAGGDYSSSASG